MLTEILTLVFVSSLPFLFSLNGDFVFDDSEAIVKNKDIQSESWLDPFNNDFWGTNIKNNLSHKSYRPLTILSFRLNYYINNKHLSAAQFKATNLICHTICCVLVWMTYCCIWNKVKTRNNSSTRFNIPFTAAIMFSVHPIHVEAVCGIVGRADLLAAITFLLSFLTYNKAIESKKIINFYLLISIVLAGISMLFKENGITILGVCCIYDLTLHLQSKEKLNRNNSLYVLNNMYLSIKCIYRIICITLSAILFLYGRWVVMGASKPEFKPTDNPASFSDDLFAKIATYNYIYCLNILLLLWPQWLSYDWSMGCVPLIKSVLDFRISFIVIFYSYIILLIQALACHLNNKSTKRIMILGFSLMVIPFLPATNIIYPVGFVIAERILYIPSIGYCLLIFVGLNKMAKYKDILRENTGIISLLIICIYGLRSWHRSFDWQNEYQLFTSALAVCPLNAKVHYNIAKAADAKQNTEWALQEYREAMRLYPEYYQAMNNIANLLKNQKKFTEAEVHLRSAIHYKKDFPAAWMNLGIVLANIKQYMESENAYKTALSYRRNYPDCYYNMGNLYLEMNKTQDAMDNWYHAIHLNPEHVSAWTNLLALLDNTGQTENAMQIIPKALAMLPDNPSVNFAVANILGKIGRYSEAEQNFLKAINFFGNRVQAIHYANLGVLYHRWKKYDLAEQMYKMALKIEPTFNSAVVNLQKLNKIRLN